MCDRIVSKALPSVPAVAPNPDRELADARACIDCGDERAALQRLDRARQGYRKQHDTSGLEHLLVLAAVLEAADERTRIGRENLVYAVKQNLRQESRRQAQQRGESWRDPYPDLQAPTEHTGISLTRGVKVAIGIGTALATAALVALFVLPWFFDESQGEAPSVTLRLVNDTQQKVEVTDCLNRDCTVIWMPTHLGPGRAVERVESADDRVDVFKLKRLGKEACLPLRVHAAYERAGADRTVTLVAKLSKATPCPGAAVLPRAAPVEGL